jgi:hypothetical protein
MVSMKTESDCTMPWLIGWRTIGDRGDVGRAAEARLVGEEPAAQALRDGGTHAAADRFLEAEGVAHDGADHARQLGDIEEDDDQRQADIAECHDWHDDVRDLGDPPDAAIDHEAGDHRQHQPGPEALDPEAVLHGAGHGVALKGVEAERECRDQADRIEHGEPGELAPEPMDDVLRRSAAIGAVLVRALVELGQRAFEQTGRHADQRDRPHPDHGTRAAEGDRDRHARDIAAADPPADAYQERFPGAHMPAGLRLSAWKQYPEHAPEKAELDEPRSQGEEAAEHHQGRDQRPAPGAIADHGEKRLKITHCTVPPTRILAAGRFGSSWR